MTFELYNELSCRTKMATNDLQKYDADFKGKFKAHTTFKKCYAAKYCIALHNLIWHNTSEIKQ